MKTQNRKEQGASLVEYILTLALILLIGMVGLKGLGEATSSEFKKVADVFDGSGGSVDGPAATDRKPNDGGEGPAGGWCPNC
jgi:Flp pilus assembly pilin Flp